MITATPFPTATEPDRLASMLWYSLPYLTGYGLTLDDLRSFHQLGSGTPGESQARPGPRGRDHHRAAGPRTARVAEAGRQTVRRRTEKRVR